MPMNKSERPKLGEYLKSRRTLVGKSQRAVGGTALSASYLTQVEGDTISDPKTSNLIKLAEAYDIPITSILRDVYGCNFDTENPASARALAIGEAVLALPKDRREHIVEWIEFQSRMSKE